MTDPYTPPPPARLDLYTYQDLAVRAHLPADYQDVRDDRVYTYFDLGTGNNEARVYRIQLNAAYAGRYYLPAVSCEAMYDSRIRASTPGKWVEVI